MTPHQSLDFRALMERAVQVMRDSVDESRGDGKACPRVGAVLVRPDGSVDEACRGELRDGDHAEYTLLERKNRDRRLDGAVLFATLEPCAPGARRHPKLGCAERIVLARIRQVWIGIEDPDPLVARKGIEYLRRAGVEVRMFDADLQQVIQEANRAFLDGAVQRAAVAKQDPGDAALSPLEATPPDVDAGDLSPRALGRFRSAAGSADDPGSTAFHRDLARLGLMKEDGGRFAPTGFGLVLFGRRPRAAMPQAGLLGTIHHADGSQEIRDFDGPQVEVPEQALAWLRDKLPALIDRTDAVRREANAPLFELVRESIVNALVHRDYGIAGAKCQLVVTPETIEVKSPGWPVEPITLEQMQAFSAPMLSRNPALHYVFKQMGLAEERGLGLRSLKTRAGELGLPLPRYTWDAPYLVLTLFRTPASAAAALPAEVRAALGEAELKGWQWLAGRGSARTAEYASALAVDDRTARRHLGRFVALGLARRMGSARLTEYVVADDSSSLGAA
jgi:ATP-dependent DNA helicase RecG